MPLSQAFDDAVAYAVKLHATQLRKGSEIPYISHLFGVASLVFEYGGTEKEAIAALLHDAVEDQGGLPTLEYIRSHFGQDVANIVESCTDAYVVPKPLWRPRKEAYIAHVAHAGPSAQLVSTADKVHNARAILKDYRELGEAVWERFTGGREGTLWYYRALVEVFAKAACASLVDELDRTVTEIETLSTQARPSRRL
jgi:(p)ppGpp synthase/HD superfamily hydrolase